MFERILVPVDGSELSQRVLACAMPLAIAQKAELCLLRVLTHAELEGAEARQASAESEARGELSKLLATLESSGCRARLEFATGRPVEAILEHARRWPASLIAMSTHGRSGAARLVLGSVAEGVLRGASVPVLVGNPIALGGTFTGQMLRRDVARDLVLRRIVVPLDGSERAAAVLPLVSRLAAAHGSEVVLLHVGILDDDMRRRLDEHHGRLGAKRAWLKVVDGVPGRVILDEAAAELADLVVLATHGRTGLDRVAFGSVAEYVLRHGGTPLLVLPPGAQAPASPAALTSAGTRSPCEAAPPARGARA